MTSIELDHSIGFSGYITNQLSYLKGNQDDKEERYMYAAGGSLVVSNFSDAHDQVSNIFRKHTHTHIHTYIHMKNRHTFKDIMMM